jgi:predicted CoA-binding protein
MAMNEELIKVFLDKRNVFAVVGASRDPRKYDSRRQVLSKFGKIASKTYVANVVFPPKVTEHMVETCKKLEITKVWMHPGSESEKAIKFCEENSIDVVYGVCVMVEQLKHTTSKVQV